MEKVTEFFKNVLNQFSGANFALLALIDLSAFGVVVLAALLGCIISKKLRSHDKRAFMWLVNAFAAVTLAVFLIGFTLEKSLAAAIAVWLVGYIAYGVLLLLKGKGRERVERVQQPASNVTVMQSRPTRPSSPPAQVAPQPAVNSVVRLEHALSIADKLLLKNLGRGDRQELEKIKTALTVLKVKGVLSAQEGEALNDMFNALLKLMAKYDL